MGLHRPGRSTGVTRAITRRLAGLLLVVATMAPLPALAQAPALPDVAPDEFFAIATVPPGPAGELLDSEELFAPDGLRLWTIAYRSTGLDGEPIAVSGLLLAPADPADSPRPVLSIAHGTTGLADRCAPSRDPAKRLEVVGAGIPAALDGWVVVATDYAGLGMPGPHPYLDGPSEGRAVLHAILAAQQLDAAGAGDRAALQGISQGGHAVLWAAQLAATEAPGTDIVGAVAAAPAGDLEAIAAWSRSGGETRDSWRNSITVAVAWSEAYGLPLDQLLTPAGLDAAARLETECRASPEAQPLQLDAAIEPAWQGHLAANSPGATAAAMPILYLQGTADPQIPVESARVTLERVCAAGSIVDYRELEGVGHAGSLYGDDRVTDARAWLTDRLAGRPPLDTCATLD